MDIQRINQYKENFDAIVHSIKSDDGSEEVEVWFARDLQKVLGYIRWENFQVAIRRAIESCNQQKINVDDHFREVTKMIALAKGAHRDITDYMLTRYACYLIAQNGDPKKEEVAFAQGYFAVQTRKAEQIAERLQELSRLETRDDCVLQRSNYLRIYIREVWMIKAMRVFAQEEIRPFLVEIRQKI